MKTLVITNEKETRIFIKISRDSWGEIVNYLSSPEIVYRITWGEIKALQGEKFLGDYDPQGKTLVVRNHYTWKEILRKVELPKNYIVLSFKGEDFYALIGTRRYRFNSNNQCTGCWDECSSIYEESIFYILNLREEDLATVIDRCNNYYKSETRIQDLF